MNQADGKWATHEGFARQEQVDSGLRAEVLVREMLRLELEWIWVVGVEAISAAHLHRLDSF